MSPILLIKTGSLLGQADLKICSLHVEQIELNGISESNN